MPKIIPSTNTIEHTFSTSYVQPQERHTPMIRTVMITSNISAQGFLVRTLENGLAIVDIGGGVLCTGVLITPTKT